MDIDRYSIDFPIENHNQGISLCLIIPIQHNIDLFIRYELELTI
jgi:hypothetical protein